MKKLHWLVLMALISFGLPGCGGGTGAESPEVEAEQQRLNEEQAEMDGPMTAEEEAEEE